MPYKDYTSRTWKVTEADDDARCKKDDKVTFEGSETQVMVFCEGKSAYAFGKYKGDTDTIENDNDYTISISLTSKPVQIKLTSQNPGLIGGSWIANDTPPGPGDS
jgi:hypothetical protein